MKRDFPKVEPLKRRPNILIFSFFQRILVSVSCFCLLGVSTALATDFAAEQVAIQNSTQAVADSIVQIRTVGGFERIGDTQISQGPTTGLIVSNDGFIVSSAFNFAQRPSSILVRLPGGKQVPAELVARDLNRMLVLLKVESDEVLPVPRFVPQGQIHVGQRAIALGRTFQEDQVDTSIGIISGLNRMQGRAIQTDCNVSAANYGGPLVDIQGRVFGVLVPMSPQPAGEGIEAEVAGAEFYDSGIGFAVPLEHVFTVLEKWKQGDDLLPGKLGVAMKAGSTYVEPPTIATVWPRSPAAEAGWKKDDTIIAINGKAVQTQTQAQLLLRPHYAGDTVTISLRRGSGDKAEEFDTEITLAGKLQPYRASFLGVLPKSSSEDGGGVIVQSIWPASPAAKAGLQEGDTIKKLGDVETPNLVEARKAMSSFQPDQEIDILVVRKGKETTSKATLSSIPEDIFLDVDLPSPKRTDELRELESLKLPQFPHEAKYLTPHEAAAPGLVIWLVDGKKSDDSALARDWQAICDRDGLVLLLAHPADDNGWQFDDLEYLDALANLARTRFEADPQRTVIIGSGKAGQLAYTLGLRRRGTFSGIVADNTPLPRTLKVPENSPTGQLAVLAILPKKSSFSPLVKHDTQQLREAGFPVSILERPASEEKSIGLDASTRTTVARWIAGLRRL